MLYPDDTELPHTLLFLFALGDMCGIVTSIIVVDRIGRKGSFYVGFGVQVSVAVTCSFFFVVVVVVVVVSHSVTKVRTRCHICDRHNIAHRSCAC